MSKGNKEVTAKDNTNAVTPSNLEAETNAKDNTNAKQKEPLNLKPLDHYKIISLISNKYLKEGKEYVVLGKRAEKMINNNQAKLKE